MEFKKLLSEDKINQIIKSEEKGLYGFFIKNFRFTYLILIAVFLLGSFALLTLPREANPEVKVPFGIITTAYPGATPTDTEELITKKIEDRIKNVDNLKKYQSSSGVGFSSISVEFTADADLKDSIQKLKDAVDEAKPDLPEDATDPIVSDINFNDIPIVTYSLVGEGFSEAELKRYADIIQTGLESIKDVSRVPVLGGIEREFQIIVDQTRLTDFNISLNQIVASIARTNFNLPAGNIDIDGYTYNVRVKGKFTEATALNDIVITSYNNTPIYLKDVATIKDDYKEKNTESRVGLNHASANNTVSLQIYKKTGGNILNIVERAQKELDNIQQRADWPKNLTVLKTNDNSVWIKQDLNTLGSSGLQTGALIIIILLLVIGLRASIITSFSLPISFLIAFAVLQSQGMTLNSMVLFSLVLSLGLMVDNSIIIMEGVYEYMSKYSVSPYKAALLSVWNYRWPIIAGTMTTVAAFAPMLLVSGILGEYLAIIPKTIIATLVSSLFVALIILPTLASRFLKKDTTHFSSDEKNDKKGILIKKIQTKYIQFLTNILPNKKKRRRFIAAAWLAFILSIFIPASGLMTVEMFPKVDIDYFIINIKMPVGTVLENTKAKALEVEKIVVESIPEMANYVTNIGSAAAVDMSGGSNGSHLASVTVNLKPKEDRDKKSYEIATLIRPKLKLIQGAAITAEELSSGPPSGSPIEARVFGDDLKTMNSVSLQVKKILEDMPGLINIKDSLEDAAGEFTFTIDKQKANYYGLDVVSIASTLRNAIYGTKASEVLIDGEDIEINVRYADNAFNSVNDLENLLIMSSKGPIPLKNIAAVSLEPSLLSIRHQDGKKVITITADTEEGVNLQKTLNDFNDKKTGLELPTGITIEVGGETEDIDQSFTESFQSMIIAIILIAFILVLQFNSFKQPFIIIFTLPLAIPGVIIGLTIFGQPFSFPVFIGIISLAGIVVNDAIVLIDKINKNLDNGIEFIDSIIDGGSSRMQPIFLTSITTIAGIIPLAFADELWRGLSIAVASGLIFSTFLTLLIVPIMFVGIGKKDYDKHQQEKINMN